MTAIARTIKAATLVLALGATGALAETSWITLGTSGGPFARPDRSQPANLLVVNGMNTVVDAGDGLSGRLAAARVPMGSVDNVLISHLHFDHIGGMLAVLGLRFQTNPPKPVQVYGPPGTKTLIEGLLAGMAPAMKAAYGMEDAKTMTAEELVQVHELRDGDTVRLGDTMVTAVKNSHYSFHAGSELDKEFESLSFRFDTPDRSIFYTGDTGPSDAVVQAAKGVDLFVTELIDVDSVMALVQKQIPDPARIEEVRSHLVAHHVTPEQIGEMASAAGVGKVLATHLVAGARITPEMEQAWATAIGGAYDGEAEISKDMGRY